MPEPIPFFKPGDITPYHDETCTVLTIDTYCNSCDRFLEEAKYSVKCEDGTVDHRVLESDLLKYLPD